MSGAKVPVQADGAGTAPAGGADPGKGCTGESGGGAYARPDPKRSKTDGFLGHGGQTELTEKEPGKLPD